MKSLLSPASHCFSPSDILQTVIQLTACICEVTYVLKLSVDFIFRTILLLTISKQINLQSVLKYTEYGQKKVSHCQRAWIFESPDFEYYFISKVYSTYDLFHKETISKWVYSTRHCEMMDIYDLVWILVALTQQVLWFFLRRMVFFSLAPQSHLLCLISTFQTLKAFQMGLYFY